MRRLAWIAPLLALGVAACGSMSDEERFSLTTPGTDDLVVREIGNSRKPRRGKPTPDEVSVIRGWADALRAGDVARAARVFAVPTIVLDGTSRQRSLPSMKAVRNFNRGLPCGAKLVRTVRGQDSFVIATFRLTERPGPGSCAGGVGRLVETAFLVEDRHILQWLRQPDPPQPDEDFA
jgi:hypothetical protein